MKKDYTDITILLDRSGSMLSIKEDTIGGIKTFVDEQKKLPGKCLLTLYQFDNESFDTVLEGVPIGTVESVGLEPRGCTPLLDSLFKAITNTGERLKAIPEDERPEFVVFMIVTDGQENASKEVKLDQVKNSIKIQSDIYKWHFTYLGANQDAFAEAGGMGIAQAGTMTFAANSAGVSAAYMATSRATRDLRTGASMAMCYTAEEHEQQRKAGVKPSTT